jgi:multiple sugar transport system permease protein
VRAWPRRGPGPPGAAKRRAAGLQGRWWRFALTLIITAIAVVPIAAVIYLSLQPGLGSRASGFTLENFTEVWTQTGVLTWLRNSLLVTGVTVLVSLAVAAPAGYVLSRARNLLVSGFSLVLFIVQSLPVVTAVILLFILFAKTGLVDSLLGVMVIYVGTTMSVTIWMMGAHYEAAWMDGASVFGGFMRVVLRNSCPVCSPRPSSPSS